MSRSCYSNFRIDSLRLLIAGNYATCPATCSSRAISAMIAAASSSSEARMRLIVRVRHLACLVFEIQIAQVFVDRFLALAEIAEPRLFFSGVDFAGKKENVIERGERNNGADENNHGSGQVKP